VDLIDAGSVSGLARNSTVQIQYEADSPRTAYIQSATRGFVSRNLSGMAVQGVLSLAVLIAFFAVGQWIQRAFGRLVRKNDGNRPAS
jgi:hypothetical protein